jgi:hypothetical protein
LPTDEPAAFYALLLSLDQSGSFGASKYSVTVTVTVTSIKSSR